MRFNCPISREYTPEGLFLLKFPQKVFGGLWHIRFTVPCLAEAWDAEASMADMDKRGSAKGQKKSRPTATLRRAWKKGEDKY